MKKLLVIVIALAGAYYAYDQRAPVVQIDAASGTTDSKLEQAFVHQRSGVQIQGTGTVSNVLSDDNDGSRHQRFILRLSSGQTLLIAHNIDLAPRVPLLSKGDAVSFFGVYEWNERGGVIHWTHHDPQGRHVAGWLEHKGKRFQ